jgi:hypothetical protein
MISSVPFLTVKPFRAWAEKEIFGDNVRLEIEQSSEHVGSKIVSPPRRQRLRQIEPVGSFDPHLLFHLRHLPP